MKQSVFFLFLKKASRIFEKMQKNVKFVKGDLFESKMCAFVNAVNCVGVMGAGIANDFRKTYPEMYKDYKTRCKLHLVELGKPYLFESTVILFPTKNHWKEKSQLKYIELGLQHLVSMLVEWNVTSMAIPALGCGLGGLDWNRDVLPLYEKYLCPLENIAIEIYLPR